MLYEHNMLKNLMKYKELKQWLRILQTMQMDLIIIVSSLNQYVCHAHRYNHASEIVRAVAREAGINSPVKPYNTIQGSLVS